MTDDGRYLLERYCRKGDKTAFTTFYRARADRLWRFLRVRGCDAEGAYDVLGEAFLRFIQVVCRDPGYPTALLYRIAINLNIDRQRHDSRSPIVSDQDAVDTSPAPRAEYDNEHAYLRDLVQSLPENEQNLLLMRYWLGMTHKEVAASMEKPEGTIRRQCATALQKLKDRWEVNRHG